MYFWQNNISCDGEKLKDEKIIFLEQIIENFLRDTDQSTPFYKVIQSVDVDKWVNKYYKFAENIRQKFKALVVISMGGAALNPQAVLELCAPKKNDLPIFFLNNTDPYFFSSLIDKLDLTNTAFLIISNSGETLETICLLGSVINEFELKKIAYQKNLYFILGAGDNHLRRIANKEGAVIFVHEHEISGRFAGLTNVTCLIGMIAGLDMHAYLTGASEVIENFRKLKRYSLPAKAALAAINCPHKTIVNLAYLQNFSAFLEWYCQIIAESLGKQGQGFTPLRGLGPNDQHSMLQLYLEGPKDKVFNLFYVKNLTSYPKKISAKTCLDSLKNKTLADINNASFKAIIKTFTDHNLPFRTIILDNSDEKSIGALIAHCMIEIVLIGSMLSINPFDQPGVELIKKHVTKLLKN